MRLLRLDLGCGGVILDLHPLVTVVSGLGDRERHELTDSIRALAGGRASGICGLVQHQGLLLELDGSIPPGIPGAIVDDVVIDADSDPDDLAMLVGSGPSTDSGIRRRVDAGVPLVITGSLRSLGAGMVDAMTGLCAIASRLQIIVVTDHPAASAWADEAGLDLAFVARPKRHRATGDRSTPPEGATPWRRP